MEVISGRKTIQEIAAEHEHVPCCDSTPGPTGRDPLPGHERLTIFVVRRDKLVSILRYVPMARAHELAKKLQGHIGTTVSVV